MRDDQRQKLEDMRADLLDQIINQAPIKDFPGWETQESRGDRYWFIKIKAAELALFEKLDNVIERRASTSVNTNEDQSVEKTIRKFEGLVKRTLDGGLAEKYRKPSDPRAGKAAH